MPPKHPANRGSHKKRRFMVIDDERDIAESICKAIELTGNAAIFYCNPVDAVAEIEKNPDDYIGIFTDLRMPHMQGEEVIRRVRQITHDIPIVIVTGTSGVFTTDDLVKLNIPVFIEKPFNISNIEIAVTKMKK